MTDTPSSELERAAADLSAGKPLDWQRLRAGGLSPQELTALEVLEAAQLGGPAVPTLEEGFEIRAELGRGAMGRVYRAFDRSLQREVALKIVAPERVADPLARASFLTEARLLAAVRHPGVVQVYSVHAHEDGIRMALELIEGRTLEEIVLAEGPFSSSETAHIGSELCRALAALHERDIVHRDLKPSNAMREKGGRIVLLDFGIARSPSVAGPLTGAAAGTPRFMAPEQFRGDEVGTHTDLWALGALLYWLASARFPHEGADYLELQRSVLEGRAVPLVDQRNDIDPRLAAILERCLSPEPRDRPRSAGELAGELRRLDASAPGLATRPPSEARPAPPGPVRGSRRWGLLALILAGVALALWAGNRDREPALEVEAQLFARRAGPDGAGNDVRLVDGDAVTVGDKLTLEVSSPEPIHVYVFNQDDTGEMHVLFPVPGFEPRNPLPAGAVHRLPGALDGEPQSWVVTTSGGGGETLLLVATRAPVQAMEDMVAAIPPVRPGGAAAYPQLGPETRAALLRGIGATTSAGEAVKTADGSSPSGRLELGKVLERLDPTPGFFVRQLRLRNR